MGVLTSLFAGVSGINAAGQQISVIGDNIANINTPGFKSSRVEFQDVLAGNLAGNLAGSSTGNQIGAGTRIAGLSQNFTQGSLESTGVTTDLAIDGGGFFLVQDTTGVFYSRSGLFRLDANQQLVNEQDQAVLGFGISAGGLPNGGLGPILLANSASIPSATALVDVNVNIDPNATAVPATNPFDHLAPITHSNFQTGIRVFDSLGNPRNVTIHFRKDDAVVNRWFWYAGASRSDLDMAAYGGSFAQGPAGAGGQFIPLQSGTLDFNSSGVLSLETNVALSIQYDHDGDGVLDGAAEATPQLWRWADGASSTTIAFDFGSSLTEGGTGADRTTQFGGSSTAGINNFVRFMNQDGFAAGSLQNVSIDGSGFVTGSFSNGQVTRLAQVALATFPSLDGLSRVGRNNYAETSASGNVIVGSPNQAAFGAIRSGFLEQSNTDLGEQFVKLIIAQRAFQANTRTIATSSDLLASLVGLGQ
ncbi:MAG: flagellar hook protein FlgE [Myxococcota bacterium]